MRAGRLIRQQAQVATTAFVPRTLGDEERSGYEAGLSMRGIGEAARSNVRRAYEAELSAATNLAAAARLRGLIRGLSEG